jgi:hypothetical protein
MLGESDEFGPCATPSKRRMAIATGLSATSAAYTALRRSKRCRARSGRRRWRSSGRTPEEFPPRYGWGHDCREASITRMRRGVVRSAGLLRGSAIQQLVTQRFHSDSPPFSNACMKART